MPGVLEESKVICDQKTIEYQELLKVRLNKKSLGREQICLLDIDLKCTFILFRFKVRIAKFIDDLAILEIECGELQYWGELDELPTYTMDARVLDNK